MTLALKNGETCTAYQPLPRGEPEVPISVDETAKKFRLEGKKVLTNEKADEVIQKALNAKGKASDIFEILAGS